MRLRCHVTPNQNTTMFEIRDVLSFSYNIIIYVIEPIPNYRKHTDATARL